jgi:localization factor PodJL
VEQSDQMAAQWFERAALIGATDSQFNLAVLYEQGRGVPQSLPDAYAWYRIAARSGDTEADERARLIAAQIPEAAAAEAQRVADAFQPRPADPVANGTAVAAAY